MWRYKSFTPLLIYLILVYGNSCTLHFADLYHETLIIKLDSTNATDIVLRIACIDPSSILCWETCRSIQICLKAYRRKFPICIKLTESPASATTFTLSSSDTFINEPLSQRNLIVRVKHLYRAQFVR
jgi:hypothetical protein